MKNYHASLGRLARLLACLTIVAAGMFTIGSSQTASASPWDPHVHLSGHIDCGGIDSASWVWVDTSWGERGWASTSAWTSISRPAGWLVSKGLPSWLDVKVQTYNIDLWRVPGGTNNTVTLTIGCTTPFVGWQSQFSTKFGLARPTIGASTTRHVCRNAALGCWV